MSPFGDGNLSEQACGWKWMRHISGEQRQTERDRQKNDRSLLPQSESWKAPPAGQGGILGRLVLPRIPTSSPTHCSTLIKSEEEGGRRGLFHSCPCLPPIRHRLVLYYLSNTWECQETGAQPQTYNADNINFLLFIPVGNKSCRKKEYFSPALNWACVHSTFLTQLVNLFPDFTALKRIPAGFLDVSGWSFKTLPEKKVPGLAITYAVKCCPSTKRTEHFTLTRFRSRCHMRTEG